MTRISSFGYEDGSAELSQHRLPPGADLYFIPFEFLAESLPGYSKDFGRLKFISLSLKKGIFDGGDLELSDLIGQEKC